MSVMLEPFLKCRVVELEFSKYPHRPFRVAFNALIDDEKFEFGGLRNRKTKKVVIYIEKSDPLGDSLCRVQIQTMNHDKALVRFHYTPENQEERTLWVPREQTEWH